MKRASILIVCAFLLLPSSQAFAGTWSWHSDIIEQIIDRLQNHRQSARPGAQELPAARKNLPVANTRDGQTSSSRHVRSGSE